jgi:hypothetical protein
LKARAHRRAVGSGFQPLSIFELITQGVYLLGVAAGVPPAVEPGILPGGLSRGLRREFRVQSTHSGRQDAALYGSQDGCRYSRKPTLNGYQGVALGWNEDAVLPLGNATIAAQDTASAEVLGNIAGVGPNF